MSDPKQTPTTVRCPCGSPWAPQYRLIRVPGTFKGSVHHIFCMNICNREGVGITYEQAVEEWNTGSEGVLRGVKAA